MVIALLGHDHFFLHFSRICFIVYNVLFITVQCEIQFIYDKVSGIMKMNINTGDGRE